MFLWPLQYFWTFTPLQFVVGLVWNISEVTKIPLPNKLQPIAFNIMMGGKSKKVK